MNGWIIFAGSVVAWLVSGTLLTRRILIGMERNNAELFGDPTSRRLYSPAEIRRKTQLDRGDRGMAVLGGYGFSLVLPLVPVLLVGAYDLLTSRTRIFHTPREVAAERADRDAAELAEYRRLAAEFDLPTPKLPR